MRPNSAKNKNRLLNAYAAALIILFCTAIGCAVKNGKVYEKDGRIYGKTSGIFKSQWDDYYLRGLSYMEGLYWEDAVHDLETAVRKRSRDQRRARTYGLHFVDYFPNRELGIAWFNQGRYEEAITALERSISCVETARAKFYLNKARESWLRKNSLDLTPPDVSVQFPPAGFVTSDYSIPLKVSANDNYFVSSILVNGKDNPLELSGKEVRFEDEYRLKNGINFITVRARDILGKTSRPVTVEVNVDREGPVFMFGAEPDPAGIRITGVFYDRSGVCSVLMNNRKIDLKKSKIVHVNEVVREGDSLEFKAVDAAGNVTAGLVTDLLNRKKKKLPYVSISGLKNGQTAYVDVVDFQGVAYFENCLKEIVINDYPVIIEKEEVLEDIFSMLKVETNIHLAFSRKLRLREGENRIRVAASDVNGKRFDEKVVLIKKKQLVKQLNSRMSLAILPFEEMKQSSGKDMYYIGAVLETAFKAQKRFHLLPGREVKRIMNEKSDPGEKFSSRRAAELGRQMGVDAVMVGEISRLGRSVEINSRFIDPETGGVLAEKDVYYEGSSYAGLRQKIDMLAGKFRKHFPLCETNIVRMENGRPIIGAGLEQSVKKGMRFLSYRDDENVLGCDKAGCLGKDSRLTGLLRVEEIDRKSSAADILRTYADANIETGDKVIAK